MFPAIDTLLPIAQVLKSYGTDGEIFIRFSTDLTEYFENKEPVFLFFDRLPVPFSITSFVRKGNSKAILKLAEIGSPAQAEEISGLEMFAPVKDYLYDEDSVENLIGFDLYDQDGNRIGVIGDVRDFSGNVCLELEESGTLIPFHEDLFLDADPDRKILRMEISRGLL